MIHPGAMWREIVKNLLRKPMTVLYPKERLPLPENFRGRPEFDPVKCIGCMLCVRDCPSKAVMISKVKEKVFSCTFLLDRCIFCGQCADSCSRKAISMGKVYELAAFSRETLVHFLKGEPPAEPKEKDKPAAK